MIDQAEQLRRRLEAHDKGLPLPPMTPHPPAPSFQPPPIPVMTELKGSGPAQVEVVNINISFWRLVILMVKTTFATIPALIIIGFIWWFIIQIIHSFFSR